MNNPMPAMNTPASPLDQLADIHLPAPVASFPWAPGWWFVLCVGLITLICIALWLYQHRRKNAFRRAALSELTALATIEDDSLFAQLLNQLLRRVALHSHQKNDIASLSGKRWIDFLSRSCGDKPAFTHQTLDSMLEAAYQASAKPLPRDALITESKTWIRRHRSHHV
ncbi:Uncharacterised protein [Zhongshania aliphaticivorans]|uniref:DUF4381 domain-containing protein n=1 Tax=Zhongshania aliphaticivorans TaxID=1470434 RepID=A0A5S9QJM6_9GAMM|nr:DUF4381 domain-containing protein [Zhongshania aliphaticivorans]CAA0109799.1 Uncharacterised protein [Zhongshania aliphaticivorans]CAA0117910.1 Uncharacterised protein [Zhongshania aliphaticivorans]CAA0121669.1 Uncharacterised protein [Zhongshania aliphaticivorans]